jgi:serine/threonine protein kinase
LPQLDDAPALDEGAHAPGALLGPYRLVRVIGRGGMGEVWLAERADGLVRRPVALKLPLLALSRGALAERLARERDALAALSHANIARLYDAGFADGQPYLALEYVDGVPVTRYADAHALDLRARLALFDQVLGAVAHAHANLILHRDIKPSNILVTPGGDVKLLDFGIAKLLTDGEARETELTRLAGAALTLDYASPEQIAGATLTTAADVYALGVVLYELLTGARPYRLKRGSRAELEEAILARDEVPPRQAPLTESIARARGTTLPRPARRAVGRPRDDRRQGAQEGPDKALRDRPMRWRRTCAAIARASRSRRVRTRGATACASSSLAIASASARRRRWRSCSSARQAFSWWQAQAAREQARIAEREARHAQAVQGFVLDIFRANSDQQPDPLRARQTTARELLDIGAARLGDKLKDAPEVEAEVADTLSEMYLQLGLDSEAAGHAAPADRRAQAHVRRARSARRGRAAQLRGLAVQHARAGGRCGGARRGPWHRRRRARRFSRARAPAGGVGALLDVRIRAGDAARRRGCGAVLSRALPGRRDARHRAAAGGTCALLGADYAGLRGGVSARRSRPPTRSPRASPCSSSSRRPSRSSSTSPARKLICARRSISRASATASCTSTRCTSRRGSARSCTRRRGARKAAASWRARSASSARGRARTRPT